MIRYAWLASSALGTLAFLAFVPHNGLKLLALLLLWALTFRPRPAPRELGALGLVCALFTVLNARALQSGIFAFSAPDVWGQPVWELLMWGYYLGWSRRVVGGPRPRTPLRVLLPYALAFALPFGLPFEARTLLVASTLLLGLGLVLFHERHDLAVVALMILLGAAIEYTGVHAGLWRYPTPPLGGVPAWFVTLWGGVGLVGRRLLPPIEEAWSRLLDRAAPTAQEQGR